MNPKDEGHILSPLSRHIERDGHAVRVDIYENETGLWTLEIVDRFHHVTRLGSSFETDQQALDEALRTIEADGIRSLTAPAPGRTD